jgi:hypothetical protein
LPTGCYTFTINDSYGDGICCTYGSGNYALKDAAGTTLASGSTFTSSASHNFCVGGATSRYARGEELPVFNSEEATGKVVYPNPVKDVLKIRLKPGAEIRSLKITTMSGMPMEVVARDEKAIDVSGFPAGMYILSVDTNKGRIVEKFIRE